MKEAPARGQAAKDTAAAAAGAGAPLGIIATWAIDTYLLPAPMPSYVAGAVFVTVAGVATWIIKVVRKRYG